MPLLIQVLYPLVITRLGLSSNGLNENVNINTTVRLYDRISKVSTYGVKHKRCEIRKQFITYQKTVLFYFHNLYVRKK